MRTHIKVLGWLYIVLGILGILTAACVALVVFGAGLLSGDRTAITVTGVVSAVIAAFLLITSVPGMVAGIGLLNDKAWARILTLVLGVLNLIGFPVGTVLGIYTLYVLLDPESAQLLS